MKNRSERQSTTSNPAGPTVTRVLHLTTVPISLGVLIRPEIEDLVARGADVHTASGPPESDGYAFESPGVTHHEIPSLRRPLNVVNDIRAMVQMWKLIGEIRPTILHTHTPKAGVYGRIIGKLRRVPIVANTLHGLAVTAIRVPEVGPRRLIPILRKRAIFVQPHSAVTGLIHRAAEWAYISLEAIAALASDCAFFLNPGDLDLAGRFVRSRARVINGGVNLDRFRPDPIGRARVRSELGADDATVVVGAVGRRSLAKGVTAFERLARTVGNRAIFVWVGSAEASKAESVQGDQSVVHFVEFTDDIVSWFSAIDIYVLPSFREGHSQSAMEAAAMGIPSVVSEIRGNSGLGTSDVEVVRYPLGDDDALRSAVTSLIDDPARRSRIGAAARERALTSYDARQKSSRYLKAYRAVAAKKGIDLTV